MPATGIFATEAEILASRQTQLKNECALAKLAPVFNSTYKLAQGLTRFG